jgi:hypothetical protein
MVGFPSALDKNCLRNFYHIIVKLGYQDPVLVPNLIIGLKKASTNLNLLEKKFNPIPALLIAMPLQVEGVENIP